MPKKPEPWWREDRQAWFVQIDRKRHNLGKNKKEAWQRYYELMARPQQRTIISNNSLLALIDAFLDWCQKKPGTGHSDPITLAKVYAHLSQNPSYFLSQAKKAAG